MAADDIHVIVERLNEPPFGMQLTLAALDEKSPFELLELVNLVLGHLSDEHKVDLRKEAPEATINRMLEFLRQLNFKPASEPHGFQQALLHGERAAVHPLLAWLLQRLPEHKKRAYLARFLSPFALPEHMFGDEELSELHAHLRSLQAAFKEAHRSLDRRSANQQVSPAEVRAAIVQLGEDKVQLSAKLDALRTRLRAMDGFEPMLEAASALRREQEEASKLQASVHEQAQQLARAEQAAGALQAAVRGAEVQREGAQGAAALLAGLEAEVGAQQNLLRTELPAALDEQAQRLAELEGALSDGPVTEEALREARAHLAGLEARARAAEAEARAANAGGGGGGEDDGLAMFRQQAALIGRKHDAVRARLDASAAERDGLERQLMARMADLEAVEPQRRSAGLATKSDDFKKYAANLRGKSAVYKRCKAQLAELRAEFGLLRRTEQLVSAQARALGARPGGADEARGPGGLAALQGGLEAASEAKAAADEAKGQSLAEIARTVEAINAQVAAHKAELAPAIKELRAVRAQFGAVEAEHAEKKMAYEAVAAGIDSELSKLGEEVGTYAEELAKEESRFHYLHAQTTILEVAAARARAEASGATRVGAAYAARLREQEEQSLALRAQQRTAKEEHDRSAGQMLLFRDLHTLLKAKAECQQRELEQREHGALLGAGGANVFTMPEGAHRYTDIDGIEHA